MSDNSLNSPGVFRGQARLATQQDLANLKEYLERTLAGPLNEVSDNGYIPWKYNTDGTLDIEYLFPELINRFSSQQGISVSSNGVNLANGVTSFNVKGKFVTLDIDENGCLTWTIDEPQVTIPNFNEANMFGSALVKIENTLVEDMIVPDTSSLLANSPFGDWEPGSKVRGLNKESSSYDELKLVTNGPVFASTDRTYFEVSVEDGNGSKLASFVSIPIKASTSGSLAAASLQNSPYISIFISNFKEESRGYSFTPVFAINLIKIIGGDGGRFNVKIVHHDAKAYAYVSEDLLYNCGTIPSIDKDINVMIGNDVISPSSEQLPLSSRITSSENLASFEHIITKYCSGIKYAQSATAIVKIGGIHNLNNMAAVDDPISYSFDIANLESSEVIAEDYDLQFDKTATFKIKFRLKDGILNDQVSTGTVSARNAFGRSSNYRVEIPVLLDSQKNLKESDNLHEWFSDESFRKLSDFEPDVSIDEYSDLASWDSTKSLVDYDRGRGLMVVPGKGVMYPHGNWIGFTPVGSPNYSMETFLRNEKFFTRVFRGNSNTKFGGVFIFEGITADEYKAPGLTILISCDRGMTWMDLKQIRNMRSTIIRSSSTLSGEYDAMTPMGVMTNIREEDGKLFVAWAYPQGISSNQPLYFKLGMTPDIHFTIKSISLLNADEEENW